MSDLLWSFDQLARFTRYEDEEVRYWAAERLTTLFPTEAPDVITELILDEHDATPDLVAEHLGRHGAPRHVPALLRGFRKGGDLTPGRCLEALAKLGYEGAPDLAEIALHRKDASEACLGIMVQALASMASRATPAHARASAPAERALEFLLRRPELFAEPAALRGAARLFAPADYRELIRKWVTALHFRGVAHLDACVRVLLEELQMEDSGWCIRTGRSGRIDLVRTLKAVESGYDLDVRDAIPPEARAVLVAMLERGSFREIAASLAAYIRSRAAALARPESDTLWIKLEALGAAFLDDSVLEMSEQLETSAHQWLIGVLISAAVKVSTYRNFVLELESAGRDIEALLALGGAETSCLLNTLPARIVDAAQAGAAARERTIDWCLRTLEARGPFFPKAIALHALGGLGVTHLLPEITAHLADDNAYIYGAAERAMAQMGPVVVDHARAVLARGGAHPDAIQSLVRVACDMGREASVRLLLDHFDDIFETIGPDAGSDLAGLLAHQDLLPPLRRWLDRSPAMVGHTILLIGAIHNLPIPEEETILKAIDDYWKGAEVVEEAGGPSGPYLM